MGLINIFIVISFFSCAFNTSQSSVNKLFSENTKKSSFSSENCIYNLPNNKSSKTLNFKTYQKPLYFSKSKKEAYCLSKVLNVSNDIRVFSLYASPTSGFKKEDLKSEYKYRFFYLIENYDNSEWKKNKKQLLKKFFECLENPNNF